MAPSNYIAASLLMFVSMFSVADTGSTIYAREGLVIKAACADCHGDSGEGGMVAPVLAGKSSAELKAALTKYRVATEPLPLARSRAMVRMAKELDLTEIEPVAGYASSLPGK